MIGVWVTVAGIGVVVLLVAGWRWAQRRTRAHDAWIRVILADDREVSELEQQLRAAARDHEGHGRD